MSPFTCGPKLPLLGGPTHGTSLNAKVETGFQPITSSSDTKINYQLTQKLKLLRDCEFNHLI